MYVKKLKVAARAFVVKTALTNAPEANESLFLSLMRTLEDAVEDAAEVEAERRDLYEEEQGRHSIHFFT